MADVMSHGGDAGGDPPHPGSSHVPSQCESCSIATTIYYFILKD